MPLTPPASVPSARMRPARKRTPRCAASAASLCVNLCASPDSSEGDQLPPTTATFRSAGSISTQRLALVRIEMQDAARKLVVFDAGLGAQLPQPGAAIEAECHQLPDVVRGTRGGAFAQEGEAPEPLAQVGAGPKEKRRVLASEPPENLARHAGIGPGLGV